MTVLSKITEREIRRHLVQRRRGGHFYLSFRFGGSRVRKSLQTSDPDLAFRKAMRIVSLIDARRSSKMVMSVLRDEFIEYRAAQSASDYAMSINSSFDSFIRQHGDMRIAMVTRKHIELYKVAMLRAVKRVDSDRGDVHYSGYTINNYLRTLRSAFSYGVRMEWLSENPFSKFGKVREMRKLPHAFSPEEVRLILSAARAKFGERFALQLEFYVLTGLRREEATHLSREMFQQPKPSLMLLPEITKKDTEREVPLSDRAAEILIQLFSNGRAPIDIYVDTVTDRFSEIRDSLNLKGKFHDLRKTTSTWLTETGLSPFLVAMVLGHEMPGVTFRNYTAFEFNAVKFAMNMIAERLLSVPESVSKIVDKVPKDDAKCRIKTAKTEKAHRIA